MRSPIHKEGLLLGTSLLVFGVISARVCKWIGRFFVLFAGFTFYFFRDPEREIPQEEGQVVSPADGKVVAVDTVEHAPFINGPAKRVSIFLSIFNVHINRIPVEGKIEYRQYSPGEFLPAYEPKASVDNEQNSIGIEMADGSKYLVKQIAGLVARRILCWKDVGDIVERGERFGLIRFGSRTEIYMPLDIDIDVKVGQTVEGGATIIGRRA